MKLKWFTIDVGTGSDIEEALVYGEEVEGGIGDVFGYVLRIKDGSPKLPYRAYTCEYLGAHKDLQKAQRAVEKTVGLGVDVTWCLPAQLFSNLPLVDR